MRGETIRDGEMSGMHTADVHAPALARGARSAAAVQCGLKVSAWSNEIGDVPPFELL